MKLTQAQVQEYEEEGMLFIPNYFSKEEVNVLCEELSQLPQELPGNVLEKDDQTVRALHGVHTHSQVFQSLIRHPRLLEPVQQLLLGDPVYIYQFKINMKSAFTGDSWPWHQDYAFWYKEDGMQEPRTVSVSIFLDEINQFNGPLYLIPGSQKEGLVKAIEGEDVGWEANVSADLKYCLDYMTITRMVEKGGIKSPVGCAGSVLYFHGNIAHGSVANISPYPRRILIITYNSVKNIPRPNGQSRPEFLVCQDSTPLQPVGDDVLLKQV